MDYNHKRKGFMKVKLVPSFGSRVSKSVPTPLHSHSSKVKPTTMASVDYLAKQDVTPQPVKKVAFVVPVHADEGRLDRSINHDAYYGAIADEYVNMKASNYISSVRERFRLERLSSERRASQEIAS